MMDNRSVCFHGNGHQQEHILSILSKFHLIRHCGSDRYNCPG